MSAESRTASTSNPRWDQVDLIRLDRLCAIYESINSIRRRAIYGVVATAIAYGALGLSRANASALFHLGAGSKIALSLAPAYLMFLYVAYFYSCAHTLLAYAAYIDSYLRFAHGRDGPARLVYARFKQKDVTEQLNVFLPLVRVRDWDDSIGRRIGQYSKYILWAAMIVGVSVPIYAFIGLLVHFERSGTIPSSLTNLYLWTTPVFGFVPWYFHGRAKPAVSAIRKWLSSDAA